MCGISPVMETCQLLVFDMSPLLAVFRTIDMSPIMAVFRAFDRTISSPFSIESTSVLPNVQNVTGKGDTSNVRNIASNGDM